MSDHSRSTARFTTGVSRSSKAHGPFSRRVWIWSACFGGLGSAVSIQIASATQAGAEAEALRRTVANLFSIASIVHPSRANRWPNSVQSPLAHDLHQAARRRAAKSASLFWPGKGSNL